MSSKDISQQLIELKSHVSNANILLLRLFFELVGLGGERVEKETSLLEFLRIIEGSEHFKAKPVASLQYMLHRIGIIEANTLGSSQEDLDQCKVDLGYSSLIVEVCRRLGEKDFTRLNDALCQPSFLNCRGEHEDHTREALFLKLHRHDFFKQPKIDRVIQELETAERRDLAGYICYNKTSQFQTFEEYTAQQSLGRKRSITTNTTTTANGSRVQSNVRSGLNISFSTCVCCTNTPHRSKVCWCICLTLLFFTLVCGACIIGVISYTAVHTMPVRVFGTSGETVVVAEFSDPLALFLTTTSTVSECLVTGRPNETAHIHNLYIIPVNELPGRYMKLNNSVGPFHRPDPDCSTNLGPDNLYLLEGSNMTFEICIKSRDPVPIQRSTLLIFDNNEAFVEYTSPVFCPQQSGAALERNLNISIGELACTSVTFKARRNGYHYIVANTPEVDLRYHYTINRFYLNASGFDLSCEFSNTTSCDLGTDFHTPVYLVDVIQRDKNKPVSSTHVCLPISWSGGAEALVAVLAVLCVAFVFIASLFLPMYMYCRLHQDKSSTI